MDGNIKCRLLVYGAKEEWAIKIGKKAKVEEVEVEVEVVIDWTKRPDFPRSPPFLFFLSLFIPFSFRLTDGKRENKEGERKGEREREKRAEKENE